MNTLYAALRLLRRDWRAGELRLLAVAVIVAVAAMTAVDFFTNRIEGAMAQRAGEVLAADLLVEAQRPIPSALDSLARTLGLQAAATASFPTVLLVGDETQLVQVKAVSDTYPLRGRLQMREAPGRADRVIEHGPRPGGVWVEPRLLDLTDLAVGDHIALGHIELPITGILTLEPDRAANLFRLSPRVMMHLDDLPATRLLGPASRVNHRLMLAGEPEAVAAYRNAVSSELPAGGRLVDVRDARPELRGALERGERFLRLTAVSAVLLALVAVALASRRFVERQADASALLRCLGASSGSVARLFTWRVLLLGLTASLIGALIGLIAQGFLAQIARRWFDQPLPAPTLEPWLTGLGIGLLVLAASALPSVWKLGQIPPLRVFRRELGPPTARAGLAAAIPVAMLLIIVVWQIGDDALAGRLIAALAVALLVFAAAARLLIALVRQWRRRSHGTLRYGLSGLLRQPRLTVIQLTGFAFGLTALLLLAIVRSDLLSTWQNTLPTDAANLFLLNIQPHERAAVQTRIEDAGYRMSGPYPMLRARWVAHNGRPIEPEAYRSGRGRRLAAREFNLSWGGAPSPDNRIVAGRWWDSSDTTTSALSVEEGFAEELGIGLGDRLRFDIGGQEVEAPVTSLRSVQWDSFNVNFFVVGSPGALREFPANFIASFYLPPGDNALLRELARAHPGVSALDVTALLQQVRDIIARGALAVEAVFAFTLAAGLVVLVAGVQASRDIRAQEAALLRTFGQSRRDLLGAVAVEFAILGAMAGLLAALAASAISYVLATAIFKLPWTPDPWLWLVAVGSGVAVLTTAGILAVRPLIYTPPIAVLRRV